MPQGKVVAVTPLTLREEKEKCRGTVEALEDDDKMGIVKGQVYNYLAGYGNCCVKDNEVTIVSKRPDGTVILTCH